MYAFGMFVPQSSIGEAEKVCKKLSIHIEFCLIFCR